MNVPAEPSISLWPLATYFAAIIVVVTIMLALSYILGQRHRAQATNEPFESGVIPVGYARFRLSAKFYLMAMFFVIFDLEVIFIFAWAIAFYEAGWTGYMTMVIFIGILIAALIYLWRVGALDWGSQGRRLRTHARG